MSNLSVGFIGLGIMGRGMATNLLKKGFRLVVYNRTRTRAEELGKIGAEIAESPSEVAKRTDIIIIMVTDGPDVEQVLFGKGGIIEGCRGGQIIIDMGTNSPEYSVSFSERLKACGAEFLDAPVTGGDVGAKEGTLTIMVGGDREIFERIKHVLEAMGKTIVYAGPVGSGQKLKLVNQVSVALQMVALVESLELAKASGLNVEDVYKVLSTGGARSFTVESYMPRIMKGDMEPGFKAAHLKKDLGYAVRLASYLNVPLPGTSLAFELYKALVNAGNGESGTQALIRLYDELLLGKPKLG